MVYPWSSEGIWAVPSMSEMKSPKWYSRILWRRGWGEEGCEGGGGIVRVSGCEVFVGGVAFDVNVANVAGGVRDRILSRLRCVV